MARYLAIDWESKVLRLVEATVGGGSVRITRAAAWSVDQELSLAQAEGQGRWLKDRLKDAGISPAPLLVALGRDRFILKEIQYPPVSEAEEPAMVRFQATKESTEASESLVIDYQIQDSKSEAGQKKALAVVVKRELVSAFQTLAKAAGLKLESVTPRAFGMAACLQSLAGTSALVPAIGAGEAAAVVSVSDAWAELAIVQQDRLLVSRFLPSLDNVVTEIRRNLLVYSAQAGRFPLHSVYLAGDSANRWAGLPDSGPVAFYQFDPFVGEDRPELPSHGRGAFVGLVGLLYWKASRNPWPIDLVHPHQYVDTRPTPRRRLVLGGALAATVVFAAGFVGYRQVAALDNEIRLQKEANDDLTKQLTRLDDDDNRIKALAEWERDNLIWIDELAILADRFGDTRTTQLTQLNADQTENKNAKDKYSGRFMIKGVTKGDKRPIDEFVDRLIGDKRYHSESKELKANEGPDKDAFPQQFQLLKVEIDKNPGKAAVSGSNGKK